MALTLSSYVLPTYRARELLNPSKEAERLLTSILKNPEPDTFEFELFWCVVTTWRYQRIFMTSSVPEKNVEVSTVIFPF